MNPSRHAAEPSLEERLVERIRAGDVRAEEELVERYSAGLSYLLRRWTRDPALAEDLSQETFLLALGKIRGGELRVASKLQAFLRGVARTLSTRYYQREARWTGSPEKESAPPDPGESQLAALLRQEKCRLILKVLGELRQGRDQEVLLRFYIAEESKEQICADLGLSDAHFHRVLFRARRRFRQLCEAHRLR